MFEDVMPEYRDETVIFYIFLFLIYLFHKVTLEKHPHLGFD